MQVIVSHYCNWAATELQLRTESRLAIEGSRGGANALKVTNDNLYRQLTIQCGLDLCTVTVTAIESS